MIEKRIAPSILSADFARLGEQIRLVQDAGAQMIHVDVMDGHFVPNITLGPPVVRSIRPATSLPLDVHLMIEEPDRYVEEFARAGANLISVHFEATVHLNRTLDRIRSCSCLAGVVLNPSSPVDWLQDTLEDLDYVLLMSVNPGFGGQKFLPSALAKLKRLDETRRRTGLNFAIEIDGGVDLRNLQEVAAAGADWIVAGSSIFHSKDPADTLRRMQRVLLGERTTD
jgi:ribulose-phosphate 3-epimerase